MSAAPRKPKADIVSLMGDSRFFAGSFEGPSWDKWKTYLRALFALPMSDADMEVFAYHTGRTTAPTVAYRRSAIIAGRRGGKSRVMALLSVYMACFVDYSEHLSSGEVATIAIIAADRKQARTVLRYINGMLSDVPALKALVVAETAESLLLSNRVAIEVHTASFRVTRGYTFGCIICDEIAVWRTDEASAKPDTEILRALRPGLASIPGSMLIMASSPYARRGALWETYQKHYGVDDSRTLVWKGSSLEMNPSLDPDDIAEAYEDDPASADAEYGGNFRTDVETFVSREVVDGVVVPDRHELPYRGGVTYRAHCDPSGGSADSMTIAVAHNENGIAVLDAVRERRPPFSPEAVVEEFCALLKSYHIYSVTGDRYAGEWPRERFRVHGIQYQLSEKPASDMYRDLLPLLNSGQCELLDNPKLIAQLVGLERRTARGGRDSISHAPKSHDDVVNAVAGALLLCRAKQPMKISPELLANLRAECAVSQQRKFWAR